MFNIDKMISQRSTSATRQTHRLRILTRVWDHALIILGIHAVGEQSLDLLVIKGLTYTNMNDMWHMSWLINQSFSRQLLTKGQQSVLQFSEQHGTVLLLVVQFQALNEILVATLLLLLLDLRVDGQEFVQLDLLLVALLGATHFLDQSQGGVQVQGAQGIA